jgi:predicted metal-dependent TIM-barrel fold hydrolase
MVIARDYEIPLVKHFWRRKVLEIQKSSLEIDMSAKVIGIVEIVENIKVNGIPEVVECAKDFGVLVA